MVYAALFPGTPDSFDSTRKLAAQGRMSQVLRGIGKGYGGRTQPMNGGLFDRRSVNGVNGGELGG